jgi:hypothetical protein
MVLQWTSFTRRKTLPSDGSPHVNKQQTTISDQFEIPNQIPNILHALITTTIAKKK